MPGELGDAVDQAGDLVAEGLADLVQGRGGVLDRVVQQRGAQGRGVQAHAGADAGDADRVGDEVLAGLAALVGVVLAGEQERLQHGLAVHLVGDLVGVLGDDREQVGQQLVLERRDVARDRQRAVVAVLGDVDRPVRGDRDDRGEPSPRRTRWLRPLGRLLASCCCWSEIAVRPQAVAGRPWYAAERSSCVRCGLSAGVRPGPARSKLASSSSVRTRTRRPASAADLGCGPSPRSRCSVASPLVPFAAFSAR